MASNKERYLIINPDGSTRIMDSLDELKKIKFKSTDDAKKTVIYLIEFKNKISFDTEINLILDEK